MDLSASYDFVVLGTHPAALWAARHLLSCEKKVLLIPVEEPGNGGASHRLIPRAVLETFNIGERLAKEDAFESAQILTPLRRFKLGESTEQMEREWRFQFGLSTKPGDDPGIRVGISYLAGVVSPEVRAAWSWEESLRTVLSLVYLDRKWDGTIRGMIDELADRGAHVAKPGQCKRVFVDRGTLVGVQMGDRSKMISAAAGICGMRSGTLHSLVSEGAGEAPRAAGWWFEMRFECEVPAVPAGVTRRMVYVEEGAPVLEILREESGVFRLRTILPMEPSTLERGFQRRLCERMMRVAGRLIPDLEYNVRKMVPDLRDAERVEGAELPALVPYENLDQIPVARRLCGHPGARGVLAGFSNLHPVNDETLPGLGALGAYRSAVSLFDAFSKKRDPGMMIPSIPSAGLA